MRITRCVWNNFRETFTFASKEVTHYFPGHMAKGLKQMQRRLKNVDLIVEVHDARIPISGRNPIFNDTINVRPHMLILNKMDLVTSNERRTVIEKLEEKEGIRKVMYTNCKKQIDQTVKRKFIPEVVSIMESVPRFHRADAEGYNLLVIGVPNVGKSSFINALRRIHIKKGKALRVGGVAGITRSVEERVKVSVNPDIYVYDSPGILEPNILDLEVGMKLAVCATMKDHLVGEDLIADYLLFMLNRLGYFQYVDYFNLQEPCDDIVRVLAHIALENKWIQTVKTAKGIGNVHERRPNFIKAAHAFLRAFRTGEIGKINLDMEKFR